MNDIVQLQTAQLHYKVRYNLLASNFQGMFQEREGGKKSFNVSKIKTKDIMSINVIPLRLKLFFACELMNLSLAKRQTFFFLDALWHT